MNTVNTENRLIGGNGKEQSQRVSEVTSPISSMDTMNPNDELFNAMLEMGCKVITERPRALMQLPKVKASTHVSESLVWRLIESGVKHLRSHDDVFTIYKDGEKYSLHRNGVIIGKFANSIEARNYARSLNPIY